MTWSLCRPHNTTARFFGDEGIVSLFWTKSAFVSWNVVSSSVLTGARRWFGIESLKISTNNYKTMAGWSLLCNGCQYTTFQKNIIQNMLSNHKDNSPLDDRRYDNQLLLLQAASFVLKPPSSECYCHTLARIPLVRWNCLRVFVSSTIQVFTTRRGRMMSAILGHSGRMLSWWMCRISTACVSTMRYLYLIVTKAKIDAFRIDQGLQGILGEL